VRPLLAPHAHITHTHTLSLSLSLVPRSVVIAAPPRAPTATGRRRLEHPPLPPHPPSDVVVQLGHPPSPPPDVSALGLHRPSRLGHAPQPRSLRATVGPTAKGCHHPGRLGRHRSDLSATPQLPPPPHPGWHPSSSYVSQHQPSSALTPAIVRLSIAGHNAPLHCWPPPPQRVCYFTQQIKALFAMIKVYVSSILCSQTQELKVLVNH
jgi:hypothetical protein